MIAVFHFIVCVFIMACSPRVNRDIDCFQGTGSEQMADGGRSHDCRLHPNVMNPSRRGCQLLTLIAFSLPAGSEILLRPPPSGMNLVAI